MEIQPIPERQDTAQDTSCKTTRWRILKSHLNNLKPQAFQTALQQMQNPILLDVRTPKEYEDYHFENAQNLSYFVEDLWEQISALPKDSTFFVYCRTGRRSIRVCTLMRNGGFDKERVFNLDGGIVAWKEVFGG
jgi:rhodanese-related sulfurtransferase